MPELSNSDGDKYLVHLLTPDNIHYYRDILSEDRHVYFRSLEDLLEGISNTEETNEENINEITNDDINTSVQEDMNDIKDEIEENTRGEEKIVIFRNSNTNEFYIRKYGLKRFNLSPIGDALRINGSICYQISEDDASRIIDEQNNNYSPYNVEVESASSIESQKETNEDYINALIQYTTENNISIFHYYVDLGNNYRNNNNYEPSGFEKNNPFIKEEDIRLLRQSNEKHIELFFAKTMSKVIELNMPKNIQELFIDEQQIQEEINHRLK